MIYLECTVRRPAGLRDTDVIAEVTDHTGRKEQVQVEEAFLVVRGNRHFLPVWGVSQDRAGLVQVELPQESAGGTNRLWVRADRVYYDQKESVPA